jgi:Galactose oxidase, central domain
MGRRECTTRPPNYDGHVRWRGSRWIVLALVIVLAAALALSVANVAPPEPSPPPASATPGAPASSAPSSAATSPPTGGPSATPGPTLPSVPTIGWSQLRPAGLSPVARQWHTWTVDPDAGVAYLYGGLRNAGEEATGSALGDLWAYDLGADRWEPVLVSGQVPEPRSGHAAAWIDGAGLVIVGGRDRAGRTLDDAWRFDPDSATWQQLPAQGPPMLGRSDACAIVDRDGTLWMIDGRGAGGEALEDVWRYPAGAGRWELVDLGRSAPMRWGAACWLDPDGTVRLFGGQGGGTFFGDLWSIDIRGDRASKGSWKQLAAESELEPRSGAASALHTDRAVIVGGLASTGDVLSSVGIADERDQAITQIYATGPSASETARATLIDDPAAERMLLFGGMTSIGVSNQIWQAVLR